MEWDTERDTHEVRYKSTTHMKRDSQCEGHTEWDIRVGHSGGRAHTEWNIHGV